MGKYIICSIVTSQKLSNKIISILRLFTLSFYS